MVSSSRPNIVSVGNPTVELNGGFRGLEMQIRKYARDSVRLKPWGSTGLQRRSGKDAFQKQRWSRERPYIRQMI